MNKNTRPKTIDSRNLNALVFKWHEDEAQSIKESHW